MNINPHFGNLTHVATAVRVSQAIINHEVKRLSMAFVLVNPGLGGLAFVAAMAFIMADGVHKSLLFLIAGSVLQELVSSKIGEDLTEREMQVLRLLAHGRTNREIAEELVVGGETVKTHVGNILTKLHLAHRTQAVVHALKQGLISLDEIEI